MHITGIDSEIPLQLTRQLLREIFDGSGDSTEELKGIGSQSTLSPSLPPTAIQLINTSPAFCATFITAITFLYPTSPPPRPLLQLLSAWIESNLYLAFVPLENVIPTAQTFVAGLTTWTTVAGFTFDSSECSNDFSADQLDLTNEVDTVLINRLHLALLKIILKAPPATLQADHLVKLANSLQSKITSNEGTHERANTATVSRVERFIQIVQAAVSSCCIQGSLRGLKAALVRLPATQLTGIVLETNKTALLT